VLFKKISLLLSALLFLLMVGSAQAASLDLTLKLAGGETAVNDLDYKISIKDNAPGAVPDTELYTTKLVISQGNNSGVISIPLAGFSGQTVSIMFTDSTRARNPEYLRTFYYSTTSLGNAAWSPCDKSKIETDTGNSFVVEAPKGRTIKGTLALPSGELVRAVSIISVIAEFEANGKEYQDQSTNTLSNGENSIDYILTVPDVAGSSTRILYHGDLNDYYTPSPATSYLILGYYADSETVFSKESATSLAQDNHTNINLTFIKGARISGTFNLPSGAATIDLPVHISVEVYRDDEWHSPYVNTYYIKTGNDSVEYSVSVDKQDFGKALRISYKLQDDLGISCLTKKYLTVGFVANTGMTWDVNSAQNIKIHGDYPDLAITALSGRRFTGDWMYNAAIGTFTLKVALVSSNGEASLSQFRMFVRSPTTQPDYCFVVPDTTDVSFYLGYWMENIPFGTKASVGYFKSENETPNFYSELTPLLGDRDRSDLDLEVTKQTAATINGKVMLPNEEVAQTENGLTFSVAARPDNPFKDAGFYQLDISANKGVIEKGKQSVQFTIPVSPDPSVRWNVFATHQYKCSLEKEETPYEFVTYFPSVSASNARQAQTVSYLDGPITIEILKRAQALQQTNGGILQMMTAILAAQNN